MLENRGLRLGCGILWGLMITIGGAVPLAFLFAKGKIKSMALAYILIGFFEPGATILGLIYRFSGQHLHENFAQAKFAVPAIALGSALWAAVFYAFASLVSTIRRKRAQASP
jgi:hypothetical protein